MELWQRVILTSHFDPLATNTEWNAKSPKVTRLLPQQYSPLTLYTLWYKVLSCTWSTRMTRFCNLLPLASLLATSLLHAQQPASTDLVSVTIEVTQIRSASGTVLVSLCDDKIAPFPGNCRRYRGSQPAVVGTTTVLIRDVPRGRYALQVFHDENGNGRADIPPEGFAFGNQAAWPPSFASATVLVGGEIPVPAAMNYLGAPPLSALGSKGFPAPAGIVKRDLRTKGLYGELYMPAGATVKSRPILLIGGSEGGIDTISQMAVSFAQAGYAALALAYWNEEGLPKTLERIPLEYFDTAITWLGSQPDLARGGVALIGWSRGAEAALLVASRNRAVRAVVAVAPSSIVWQGMAAAGSAVQAQAAWTVDGKDLAFVTPHAKAFQANPPSLVPVFTSALNDAARNPLTAIPVERIRGNVLLITGADDQMWPSQRFADRIIARLQGAGSKRLVEQLEYRDAGHFVFVGAPDGPMAQAAVAGGIMGGTTKGNSAAWADNWPRTLAFLSHSFTETTR